MTSPQFSTAPLIACINSSLDLVNMLRDVLIEEGFRAIPYVTSLTENVDEILLFLQQLQPNAVIYAVSPPYDKAWTTFERVRAAFPGCRWVITTTNRRALEDLIGPTAALEIIGKPYDLDTILNAVRRALSNDGSHQ